MNVQIFFKKNLRYITIGLVALFFIKSFQSCSRNMKVSILEKEIVYIQDSLSNMYGVEKNNLVLELQKANDSIRELNYLIKLAETEKLAAEKRADAVQNTAERVRRNTTIKIENKNSEKDTISVKEN